MKDFDIVKYLREHQLGSYGILNHYVDLKPLKEESEETELEKTIPYEGPEHQLTGNGGGDEFEQAEIVSENESSLDFDKITGIEIDGIDYSDYPDFVDAYISSADYEEEDGSIRPLTDDELEMVNDDSDFRYNAVMDYLH